MERKQKAVLPNRKRLPALLFAVFCGFCVMTATVTVAPRKAQAQTCETMMELIAHQGLMVALQEAAMQAQEIIEQHTEEFMGWLRSLDAVSIIQNYRGQAEGIRDEVLERALRQLHNGKDPEEVLQYLAHTLTNKILHTPSAQIRQAGYQGQQSLLRAADTLLKIKEISKKQ